MAKLQALVSFFDSEAAARLSSPETSEGMISLAGVLQRVTPNDGETQLVMTFPTRTLITEQARQIVDPITRLLSVGHEVALCIYASGRDAIAAFETAIQLQAGGSKSLSINIVAIDPKPDDTTTAGILASVFSKNLSWVTRVAELNECSCIKQVHVIFSSDQQNGKAILPVFANTTQLTVNVTPGCLDEMDKFVISDNKICPANNPSMLVYYDVFTFLTNCGISFNYDGPGFILDKLDAEAVGELMQIELQQINKSNNYNLHLGNSIGVQPNAEFLNFAHQQLLGKNIAGTCALTIDDPKPTKAAVQAFLSEQVTETKGLAVEVMKETLSHVGSIGGWRQPALLQQQTSAFWGWLASGTNTAVPPQSPDQPENFKGGVLPDDDTIESSERGWQGTNWDGLIDVEDTEAETQPSSQNNHNL